ncbi:helix-turn-helix domain-containing protein [Serratia fonticola]|jgi:DNA-binding winged helix-turn-helix (wHTH) protein|uniref:winged helix-turn-helix domain-containing protein n=1 Tax=Serratia TaxID=613 RepID=UPI00080FF4C5|nr:MULTISPECIES: helix-turn-helix domain-containing protein [Serratia]MCO7511991.1 helix-turn-helix domain-containing protein [Serratia fonticola]OCJ45490.1 hypothetical protein A6U95_18695 [Serratia sp. 14-2641]
MEYIINGSVKYNSLDCTLFCPDNNADMITLTRVTSELLLLLIQNNHTPLSRDTILSELWEKRGLSASSNNLNNYVSMLRKALAKCGYSDLITTIPKHGFLFEAEVVSTVENDNFFEVSQFVKGYDLSLIHFPGLEKNSVRIRRFFSLGRKMFKVSMLSLLVIALLPSLYGYFKLKSIRTEFFTFEQCQFYLADDKTRGDASSGVINTLKTIVTNERLNCGRKANVYYFSDKKEDSSGHAILTDLLSYCPANSKAPCDNYYLTKHVNEDEK